MKDYKEGLYDELITQSLREFLYEQEPLGLKALTRQLEANDCPEYLARHLIRQLKSVLASLPAADRKARSLHLANDVLSLLESHHPDLLDVDPLDATGDILSALYRSAQPPLPPTTPLGTTTLIMNAVGEPRLGFELARELTSSDAVFMLVSFIQWRGWQRLKNAFEELTSRSIPIRILTTTYIGATDFRAIHELAKMPNVQLRISLDGRRRRLHAKAWLFQRESGFSSVYVGSANLSGPALEDGVEWTVKLSEVEAPQVLDRFRAAFDTLWSDDEFELFRPEDVEQCRRIQMALERARSGSGNSGGAEPLFFDLRPHPYQQATLDRLESERIDRGFFRNLVVAPTGTGKTLTAAFDYARQPFSGRRPRLLFLAHREELLRQARDRFRHVLRDECFGELLAGSAEPSAYDHLFATIQSFRSRNLLETHGPEYWHYAVLDEAHHVAAESYRALVASLRPRILLGLTATPERMDGETILPWFDHRVADEMRLWNAIERQYLVPFDFYGIHDGTDLSGISWSRGSYAVNELEVAYLENSRRANLVVKQFCETYGDWEQARALGFCVSIAHAKFMAEFFCKAGIHATAITSESPAQERARATSRLRTREVTVLFTVDLFNEGIDIPEIDCVLFLRPTESSTVFLQQLGRGLRLDTGKSSCLVLDFIGNQRREFRFDQRFRALLGGTRQQLVREIETGITRLPGNCYFRLDKESQRIILDNLKTRLKAVSAQMIAELHDLGNQLRRRPSLSEYLSETGYELEDIYKGNGQNWSALLESAHLLPSSPTDTDRLLSGRFRFLLHIDSPQRWQFYRAAIAGNVDLDNWSSNQKRMAQMLTFRLLQKEAREPRSEWNAALQQLGECSSAKQEFQELSQVLLDRVRSHETEQPEPPDSALFVHRQYTRDEVLVGLGKAEHVGSWSAQTGCYWIEAMNTEVFFVTLDKSEKTFSPSTRYEDFAVSRTRFHWQSQSTTSEDSATGIRYVHQRENGTRFLLFVRPKKQDPFLFLGPVMYVSHTGSRPMSIYWGLVYAIPAWFFDICASLRAA